MTITYLTGDATQPVKTPALIMHVCNDIGGWGRGFVLALSKRWPEPERVYRETSLVDLEPGSVQFTRVGEMIPAGLPQWRYIMVANMIAQRDIRPDRCGTPPIRYDALALCLERIAGWCEDWFQTNRPEMKFPEEMTIHAPRIGCGLAGGSWSVVEPLIDFYLRDREVYIYDLPGAKR